MTDIVLLLLLVVCAIAAISMRNLVSAGMLLAVYSLLMALVWTRLNAVDVAFTEASVGAGITTVLLIAAISRTKRKEAVTATARRVRYVPLVMALVGATLLYGTLDMPDFGDPDAPANGRVAAYYLEHAQHDTAVDNIVTSVLASYRGYDTLGETTVIFTAGICVVMLLRRRNRQRGELAE